MRILIDAHMVGECESGNERYIFNLIKALVAISPPAEFIVAASHPEAFDDVLKSQKSWQVAPVSAPAWRRLGYELPLLARQRKADLMHVTYAAPPWPGCKVVTTVHDVSFKPHPEWFSRRDQLVLRVGVGVTLAMGAEVLTISEYTHSEIIRFYGVAGSRIHVAHLAGDSCFKACPCDGDQGSLIQLGVRCPYVLAVGNLQPRKNLIRLLQAVASVKREHGVTFQLVIAGKAQWRESDVSSEVRRLGLEQDVLFPGYVSDQILAVLYRYATVFVYPSLYEGFGLPVLEAMACGTPVVTSRCTSIPEVAGDAAIMVDPANTVELSSAVGRILTDSLLAASLCEKGLKQAARFTWERTARQTWDVYRRIVEGS